jgi:hypothetical protein
MRTIVEGRRGCGWRKPGAMYLVSGNLSEPCPRLPFETEVCPTCGEGIKPARGYTWVDGGKLVPPTVHGTDEHDLVCPRSPARDETGGYAERFSADAQPPKLDRAALTQAGEYVSRLGDRCGLIWIGEQHYKTPEAFTREAAAMGVSRRITAVPRDFEVGETWVLLGHRKAIEKACSECGDLPLSEAEIERLSEEAERGYDVDKLEPISDEQRARLRAHVREGVERAGPDPECPVCEGTGYEHVPGIVTAFRPTAIEYVVKGDETEEELEALEARGIEPVEVIRAEQEAML